ncbi:MAG: hypothetical protein Kow0031_06160 [Anaerolineae bacterium]
MPDQLFSSLSSLNLTPTQAQRLGLAQTALTLRRTWPRSAELVGLEYLTADGQIVPGQWLADPAQVEQVVGKTRRSSASPTVAVVDVAATKILLQSHGADRHLPGLAALLAQPDARLLVHRPERRAVVRLQTASGPVFAKLVRPDKVAALVASHLVVGRLVGQQFAVPQLLEVDEPRGITLWSALLGRSLYDLVGEAEFVPAARLAGSALRALHNAAAPASLSVHSAASEGAVLQSWIDRLHLFAPDRATAVHITAAETLAALAHSSDAPRVLLHRDFYDKQIFVDADGSVGLLDFDTLTTGEAALDLANALVHFELRAISGGCSRAQADAAGAAMLAGYRPGPAVCQRLNLYADATRLRLACVYSFRPYGMRLLPLLLARVGQNIT